METRIYNGNADEREVAKYWGERARVLVEKQTELITKKAHLEIAEAAAMVAGAKIVTDSLLDRILILESENTKLRMAAGLDVGEKK